MNLQEKQSNKFTGFINPIMNLIDNGIIYRKGFVVLYWISAVVCLLSPLILLPISIGSGQMLSGRLVFALLIVSISFIFPCWLGFQVFWNRMKKVNTLLKDEDDFVAIPLVADYIKTSGEFVAITSIGSIPCLILLGIFVTVIEEVKYILPDWLASLFGPVAILTVILGYVFMISAKFIAEMITALASIANNTKTARNANFTAKSVAQSLSAMQTNTATVAEPKSVAPFSVAHTPKIVKDTEPKSVASSSITQSLSTATGVELIAKSIAPSLDVTQAPTFKKQVRPEITDEIRKSGVNGIIRVRILIDIDGKVKKAVAHNDLGFGTLQSAIAACLQMEFTPAKIGDEIVAVWLPVSVRFEKL
ncbi:MAG: energy transducer TonB [Chitinivibrionia bacterium]|nr:energy transducer TonB [Chitinivibrionia bacterium]